MPTKAIGKLTEMPRAPSYLSKDARKTFKEITAYLLDRGTLHSGDLSAIEEYSEYVVMQRELFIAKTSAEEWEERIASTQAILRLAAPLSRLRNQLGLNPQSRVTMTKEVRNAEKGKPKDEEAWSNVVGIKSC